MAEPIRTEDEPKIYTKKELQGFVAEISRKVVDGNPAYLHAMLAMNHLLRQANLKDLLDADLKEQMKDIWLKLKTTGLLQLQDPPILFGIPDNAINFEDGADGVDTAASTADAAHK